MRTDTGTLTPTLSQRLGAGAGIAGCAPPRRSGVAPLPAGVEGGTRFSRDGRYRYSLTRAWGEGARVLWVMLNPSRASDAADDRTIRRCTDFARAWGCGSLEAVNLFAAIATHPADLRAHAAPVGPRNDEAIRDALGRADLVVAAWGAQYRAPDADALRERAERVRALLPEATWCLGVTVSGDPRHPLRLAADTALRPLPR